MYIQSYTNQNKKMLVFGYITTKSIYVNMFNKSNDCSRWVSIIKWQHIRLLSVWVNICIFIKINLKGGPLSSPTPMEIGRTLYTSWLHKFIITVYSNLPNLYRTCTPIHKYFTHCMSRVSCNILYQTTNIIEHEVLSSHLTGALTMNTQLWP